MNRSTWLRPKQGDGHEALLERSNDTHTSTTDPDARLARKSGGYEAQLAYRASAMSIVFLVTARRTSTWP